MAGGKGWVELSAFPEGVCAVVGIMAVLKSVKTVLS
jgi:hypothetical protein